MEDSMSKEQRARRDNGKVDEVVMPVSGSSLDLPHSYTEFFASVKIRIKQDRLKAQLSANSI